jgi:hypothetical protein
MVRRIVDTCYPQKVILCGSRARGKEKGSSDFGLLVVPDTQEGMPARSAPLYGALSSFPVGMDTLARTPEEMAAWSGVRQSLDATALREGRVLYGAS